MSMINVIMNIDVIFLVLDKARDILFHILYEITLNIMYVIYCVCFTVTIQNVNVILIRIAAFFTNYFIWINEISLQMSLLF